MGTDTDIGVLFILNYSWKE